MRRSRQYSSRGDSRPVETRVVDDREARELLLERAAASPATLREESHKFSIDVRWLPT